MNDRKCNWVKTKLNDHIKNLKEFLLEDRWELAPFERFVFGTRVKMYKLWHAFISFLNIGADDYSLSIKEFWICYLLSDIHLYTLEVFMFNNFWIIRYWEENVLSIIKLKTITAWLHIICDINEKSSYVTN